MANIMGPSEFFAAVRVDADPSSLFTEYMPGDVGSFTVRYGVGGWAWEDRFIAWGDVVWDHDERPNPYIAQPTSDFVYAPGETRYVGSQRSDAESAFVAAVEELMIRKEEEANGGRPV